MWLQEKVVKDKGCCYELMITPKKGKSTVAYFTEWVDDVETVLN